MTCIAGIADGKKVWIGGDSAGVAGSSLVVRADQKIFRNGKFLFGFTSSFRMGDLLRFAFQPPEQLSTQTDRGFLCTTFIDAVRTCFANGGFKTTKDGSEMGGTFLLGYKGRLYQVSDDFQVGQAACGYDAVGCGHDIAKGALHALNKMPSARERILFSLKAAAFWSADVRGPFVVMQI